MIPRLGDGNYRILNNYLLFLILRLEIDSPSRGRKPDLYTVATLVNKSCLEIDSPSRGRKLIALENSSIHKTLGFRN